MRPTFSGTKTRLLQSKYEYEDEYGDEYEDEDEDKVVDDQNG